MCIYAEEVRSEFTHTHTRSFSCVELTSSGSCTSVHKAFVLKIKDLHLHSSIHASAEFIFQIYVVDRRRAEADNEL